MYEEHAEHARHHEELRTNATGMFFALISGLLAITVLGAEGPKPFIGIMVCLTSVVGCALTWTHYRRFELHREILKAFRCELAKGLQVANTAAGIRKKYEDGRLPLHGLYVAAFVLTFLIGVVITVAPFVPCLSPLISGKHIETG